ncbi:telomeric repeat-binding factor 1 [Diretmus argenteus]
MVVKPVDFSHVEAVANGWMLDFWFVSLCRYFKEDKLDEFNETLSTFEDRVQKRMICAFLARIMHGKQLDVQFEMDDRVMPLMSAADIWLNMRDTVAGEKLFEDITNLLLVQSVAVCLDNGQRSKASSALKWFEKKNDLPQKLRLKLSTIVAQRDTYHPLLLSYTFPRLLETVESYVDAFLEKNPSDYLLQKWTYQLDQNLKHGFKRHGTGKWARILLDYDFEGRTGTQLKDRWRVLKRNHEVS